MKNMWPELKGSEQTSNAEVPILNRSLKFGTLIKARDAIALLGMVIKTRSGFILRRGWVFLEEAAIQGENP